MRITALVKSPEHVCCRYRVGAFRAHLESLGHAVDIRPWSSGWFLQQMLPPFLGGIDVLIVHAATFSSRGSLVKLLRRRAPAG